MVQFVFTQILIVKVNLSEFLKRSYDCACKYCSLTLDSVRLGTRTSIVTTKIDSLALQGTIVEKTYAHSSVISLSNIVPKH